MLFIVCLFVVLKLKMFAICFAINCFAKCLTDKRLLTACIMPPCCEAQGKGRAKGRPTKVIQR